MIDKSANKQMNQRRNYHRVAVRVVFFYVLLASLWILLSDSIVNGLFGDPKSLTRIQTLKGWLFVAVTGGLLYLYLRRCLNKMRAIEQSSEEKTRLQYQQMGTLFDSFNTIIYVADMQTHELLYVNRYTIENFGRDWRKKTCYNYLQNNISAPCQFCTNPQLSLQGAAGPAIIWELQNTRNQRWYECLDKAIIWNDGRLVRLEIALDITERKELEQTKEELLSAVSHEMRTPLTAITGFAELLLDSPDTPEHVTRQLRIIFNESEKMIDLINTFLDLRRLKTDRARVNYESLDVETIICNALKASRDCKDVHDIEIACTAGCLVTGNKKELNQAISQLINNACRFSPEGGPITITGQISGDEVVISVADQGIGIPAEQQAQVFDHFFRIDRGDTRRTGGIGLGLALVKDIIELHGGRVWLESTPGDGSCFYVSLPKSSHANGEPPLR